MYAFAAIMIAITSCAFLGHSFDKHTTHVREVVLVSVLTALSVISRFVFAPLPGFKPMTAIIVLTGIYLGKEAGFLCGAFTALISNMYFGQGPWTPFQMFSFGLIGLLAGILAKFLKRNICFLCIYGVIAGIAYSMIMDVWTVLWYQNGFQLPLYKAALITAIPYTVSYAISNVVFLLILRKPMGRKLERISQKYCRFSH